MCVCVGGGGGGGRRGVRRREGQGWYLIGLNVHCHQNEEKRDHNCMPVKGAPQERQREAS